MKTTIDFSGLKTYVWHEYVVRFFFGGFVTAAAAVIAKEFGPVIGGLFLAFPAIFPAGASLIENHEKKRKEKKGLHGIRRARSAVALDAAGAGMGSAGLLIFALIGWKLLVHHSAPGVIALATLGWALVSLSFWMIWKAN